MNRPAAPGGDRWPTRPVQRAGQGAARFDLRVHAAMLFVQLTFGAFHVIGKGVLLYLSPLQLAALRAVLAAPALLLLAYWVDRRIPPLRALPGLALLGFLGVFANQVLYVLGLQRTGASSAAILMLSVPVFTTAAAMALRIERPSVRAVAGVAVAIGGAIVILKPGELALGGGAAVGNALILGNCLAYALYLVLQRPMLERLPPLTLVAWSFLFGGAAILAVSVRELAALDLVGVPLGAWAGLAYVVVIPTVVNYAINSWAIRRSSPALVATFTTLQPLAAAALAVIFLDETLGMRDLAGFLLIVAGLTGVSGASRSKRVLGEQQVGT